MATTANSFFQRATRIKSRARIAIDGPSGSGKSFTALRIAFAMACARYQSQEAFEQRRRVAVINSESGAIQKYSMLSPDGIAWDFDCGDLTSFSPTEYTQKIMMAGQLGYDVIIVDSLSHAWEGTDGALELVSKKGGNSYTAWKDVTPLHRKMVDAIIMSPADVICTMRSKVEFVLEQDSNGKQVPRKIGMAPIQRQGLEYEFDLYASMDWSHTLTVSKSRCPALDGAIAVKPSGDFIQPFIAWLMDGVDAPAEYYACTDEDLKRAEQYRIENDPEYARKVAEEKKIAAAAVQRGRLNGQAASHRRDVANGSASLTPTQATTAAADAVRTATEAVAVAKEAVNTAAAVVVANDSPKSSGAGGKAAKPKMATRTQLAEIRKLFASIPVPQDGQVEILEYYGASGIDKLTAEQALECIENLKEMTSPSTPADDIPHDAEQPPFDPADAKQHMNPKDHASADWSKRREGEVNAAAQKSGGKATESQLARIADLGARLGWPDEAKQEYLAGQGVESLQQLSMQAADDLIGDLVAIELQSSGGLAPPNS